MARNLLFGVAALILIGATGITGSAQDSLLQDLYGRGVHAYFSRSYEEAHKQLSASIEQGSRDPRCYYFRGLSFSKLGRPDEAKADFKAGADLEAATSEQFYDIANGLQRIQDADRLALESARQTAKLDASKRDKVIKRTRYEQFQEAEQRVLRKPSADVPAVEPAPPAVKPVAPAEEEDDLFGGGKTGKAPAKTPEPPMPAEKPAEDDPFGEKTEKPAGKPAAEKPDEEMPAEDKPAGEDPFGEEKPAPAKPAAKKPAAPDKDDPFADDAPDGDKEEMKKPADEGDDAADEKPADKKPATEDDDPFADDKPDAKEPGKEMPKEDGEPADENADDKDADKPADKQDPEKPAPPKADDDEDPFGK